MNSLGQGYSLQLIKPPLVAIAVNVARNTSLWNGTDLFLLPFTAPGKEQIPEKVVERQGVCASCNQPIR